MTSSRTLMHLETQDATILVTEETRLLEEPAYKCLSPLEGQCEE